MSRSTLTQRTLIAVAILLLSSLPNVASTAEPVTISVTVSGIRSTKGSLDVCLWSASGEFPLCQPAVQALHRRAPVSGSSMVIRFEGVNAGNYAVSVHHDEDGDGRFGRNFIGMPTEGIGISGNRKGMPDYRSAILSITTSTDLVIELRYLGGGKKSRPP